MEYILQQLLQNKIANDGITIPDLRNKGELIKSSPLLILNNSYVTKVNKTKLKVKVFHGFSRYKNC